ncbi:Lrp/AsnC ligand binding domain-containing protein [Maricaulis salignorans]|uniref:AsnC family protein n=1 Tax=Maricaulis salignorans TaxID=144026 RepID=A0A1G9P527_9PROT|nr:Lrp/AsnC ligand binding domain-containing protein [Maricaulis salignorans]SDL93886.1 AsnC family protein [Maricaulis salignorans]
MRQFYVFINCELGHTYDVAASLVDKLDEAPMVHSISGAFDLLAHFGIEDDGDIGRFVNEKVQTIPGIKDTQTIICFNAFTRDRGLG